MQEFKNLLLLFFGLSLFAGAAACSAPEKPPERSEAQIESAEKARQLFDREKTDEAGETAAEFEGAVIVMLGDSLTAGYKLPTEDALPAVLEQRLSETGRTAKIINAGVSGDTSGGGLGRFNFSVAVHEPDIVVLALGANDVLQNVDPRRTRNNLAGIIESAQSVGSDVLLLGLSTRSSGGYTDPRLREFEAIYPELSSEYDVPLIREMLAGVRDNPQYLQQDGVHPTADGVEIMADQIEIALVRLLDGMTP